MITFFRNKFLRYTTPYNLKYKDGIRFWREKILLTMLLFTSLIGTITFLASAPFYLQVEDRKVFLVNLSIYLCVIVLTVFKSFPFKLRAIGFILFNQMAAVVLLITLGPFGTIPIWLTLIPLLTLLFMGFRFSMVSLFINIVALVSVALLNIHGFIEWEIVKISPQSRWTIIIFNYSLLNLAAIVVFTVVIKGLQRSLEIEKNITRELTSKQAELLASQTHLREEVKERRLAVNANEAKNEFIANVSHEIRTPMHHILSYSKFGINKAGSVPLEKLIHYFSQIRRTSERLMYLLNDLLDLSKIESGRMDLHFRACHIPVLLNEVKQNFAPILNDKNLTILLLRQTNEVIVDCDSFRMGQVLQNILSNAIKYSSPNDTIEVIIKADHLVADSEAQKALTIEIKDRGIGIPEDEIDSIFEEFVQSSLTNDGSGGTGLGLSISKKIIICHQGKIRASNNPEGGATVSITIPLKQSVQN